MKKIIGAAALAVAAAGMASADAKINLNYRSKLDAFSLRKVDLDGNKTTTKEWMDWAGYDGKGSQEQNNASDTFKFVLNGDNAGVTFATDINPSVKDSSAGTLFVLNEYSAWMKFPAGPGTLTLTSGNWKNGYADGNYRVKKDHDAANTEGMDFETFKLGTIFNGTKALKFVDDLTSTKGQTAISGFAEYDYKMTDDMGLKFLVGGTYMKFDEYENDDKTDKTYWDSNFVSRVQFNMKNAVNAEFIYKNAHSKDDSLTHTFALYVMPQVMDALTLNVGGAMEVYGGENDYTDWAIDLRARYQVMNPLSITFYTNVSGTNLDAGRELNAGIAGRKGSWGYLTTDNKVRFKTAMWNQLGFRYVVNDLLTATLNVGLITPLAKVDDDDNSYTPEWRVTPAVQVYAASNASIWAGVAISGLSYEDYSSFNVSVPVIFRVKM